MNNLLRAIGVAFDGNINDEAFVILQAINLLENTLGVKNKGSDTEAGNSP